MLNHQLLLADQAEPLSIVLMHGLFGESGNLMNIAKALHESLDATVVVPDMLSHGLSEHTANLSYSVMAESVEQLIDRLKLDNVVLIGHSMGGKVVMQMAARQKHFYKAVIIADIAPVDYDLVHSPIIESMLEIERAFDSGNITQRKEADQILALSVEAASLRQFLLKNLKRNSNKQWAWQFGLHEIAQGYSQLAKSPSFQAHAKVYDEPCLVIKGGDSNYIKRKHHDAFQLRFSHLKFKVIEGAGHWLHAEKPRLFISLIQQFLRDV